MSEAIRQGHLQTVQWLHQIKLKVVQPKRWMIVMQMEI